MEKRGSRFRLHDIEPASARARRHSSSATVLKMKRFRQPIFIVVGVLLLVAFVTNWRWQARIINEVSRLNNVPHPGSVQKAMVIPKILEEDVAWAYDLQPEWTPYVYTMAQKPEKGYKLVPPSSQGREAMAYLTFIIDNYHDLPNITAFVHGNREQRHNVDLGPWTDTILQNLRVDTVIRDGYVNLRCETAPNCPIGVNPLNPTETDIQNKDTRAFFAKIYMELFAVEMSGVPEHIGGACCAQFALSRDQIKKRPLKDYVRMREWLMTTKDTNDFGKGWVFENIWHIVFGKEAIHCPDREKCKCDLFGWCGPHSQT